MRNNCRCTTLLGLFPCVFLLFSLNSKHSNFSWTWWSTNNCISFVNARHNIDGLCLLVVLLFQIHRVLRYRKWTNVERKLQRHIMFFWIEFFSIWFLWIFSFVWSMICSFSSFCARKTNMFLFCMSFTTELCQWAFGLVFVLRPAVIRRFSAFSTHSSTSSCTSTTWLLLWALNTRNTFGGRSISPLSRWYLLIHPIFFALCVKASILNDIGQPRPIIPHSFCCFYGENQCVTSVRSLVTVWASRW